MSPKTPCHKAGKTKRSKRQHVQLVQLWLGLPPKVAGKAYENCKEIGDDDPLRRGANQTSALSAPEGRPSKCLDGPCFSSPSRLFPLVVCTQALGDGSKALRSLRNSPGFPKMYVQMPTSSDDGLLGSGPPREQLVVLTFHGS